MELKPTYLRKTKKSTHLSEWASGHWPSGWLWAELPLARLLALGTKDGNRGVAGGLVPEVWVGGGDFYSPRSGKGSLRWALEGVHRGRIPAWP